MIKINDRPNFYNDLDFLIKRPQVFFVKSIMDVYHFYNGYEMAILTKGVEDLDLQHFKGFNDFVRNKFNINSELGWWTIISSNFKTDHIEVFKSLLNEFRDES